ncbi:MAG TPA: hypothetical protein VFM18_18020 [Methanosarcina sp.]|nr:hypothetical protein [Methanosarcina sp.]
MIDDELRMFRWSSETRQSRVATLIFLIVMMVLLFASIAWVGRQEIRMDLALLPITYMIVQCSVRAYAGIVLQPKIEMWDALKNESWQEE